MVTHDPQPEIRQTSAYVMGEIGYLLGPETVTDVLEAASSDPNPKVRASAEKAIARASEYRPKNLRKLLEEQFGKDSDLDALEQDVLRAKDAVLSELKR